jgi:hypothetical protein
MLASRPLRTVPPTWRAEVLAHARHEVEVAPPAAIPVSRRRPTVPLWSLLPVEWRWLLGLWASSLAALALICEPGASSTRPIAEPVTLWSMVHSRNAEWQRLAALPGENFPEVPHPPVSVPPAPRSALRPPAPTRFG